MLWAGLLGLEDRPRWGQPAKTDGKAKIAARKMEQRALVERASAEMEQRRNERRAQRRQRLDAASMKLQSSWRGKEARKHRTALSEWAAAERERRAEDEASQTIQAHARSAAARREVLRTKAARERATLDTAASSIQTKWRDSHRERKELYAGLAKVLAEQERVFKSYRVRLRNAEREDAALLLQRCARGRQQRKRFAGEELMRAKAARAIARDKVGMFRHDLEPSLAAAPAAEPEPECEYACVPPPSAAELLVPEAPAASPPKKIAAADVFPPLPRVALLKINASKQRKKAQQKISSRVSPRIAVDVFNAAEAADTNSALRKAARAVRAARAMAGTSGNLIDSASEPSIPSLLSSEQGGHGGAQLGRRSASREGTSNLATTKELGPW